MGCLDFDGDLSFSLPGDGCHVFAQGAVESELIKFHGAQAVNDVPYVVDDRSQVSAQLADQLTGGFDVGSQKARCCVGSECQAGQ
jgi:hypothetical protein